jgi:hypothetical protein
VTIETRPARKAGVRERPPRSVEPSHDDPVSTWMLPDEDARLAHLLRLFAPLARHHHLDGGGVEVTCDLPITGAAALWDPPNRWKQSPRPAGDDAVAHPHIRSAIGFSVRARRTDEA